MSLKSKFLIPPGGWFYNQGFTMLESETYSDLVKRVTLHRENNHLPIGNVEHDIQQQICERWPVGCEEG